MPAENSPSDGYSRVEHSENMSDNTGDTEPLHKKRRLFLQTLGQQLREFGPERTSAGGNAARSADIANRIQFPRSVYGVLEADRVSRSQVQMQSPESDIVPGEDDQLPTGTAKSASKYLWRSSEVLINPPSDGSHTLEFDDLVNWSASYFDNWHPAYPYLHAPSILEYFTHVVSDEIPQSGNATPFTVTILRSIMSISLADRRQTGTPMRPIPADIVFNTFNDAIDSVQRVLTDESSIQALQAVVSVQLFLISMLRYNAASRLAGLAVRMAFHIGLHGCPMRSPTLSEVEAELRKRLFWSIYCIDRYICVRLGLPLAIRDDDIDVCYPGSEQHMEGNHNPPDRDDRLDLLNFLARHAQIRGSIMELRNKSVLHSRNEADQAVVINSELTKWWNEVDEYLESNDNQSLPISRFHQVTLVVLRYESIISLNRFVLATSQLNSAYNAALQNCIGASRSVINTLHKALKNWRSWEEPPASEVSGNTPLLWPSFTWAVWMSAFIIIYAANEDQVPQQVATKLADRSLEILKQLTLRGSMWPDACAVAIGKLRARLMERSSRSKHTDMNDRQKTKTPQTEGLRRAPQRAMVQVGGVSNDDIRSKPANPKQLQHAGTSPFRTNQRVHQERQNSVSGRGDSINSQEYPETSFALTTDSLGGPAARLFTFPGANVPSSPAFQNSMFSDIPSYADPQWYPPGMTQQLSDVLMPNSEGTDLFYGSDIPFWMGDDQCQGLGGSHWA